MFSPPMLPPAAAGGGAGPRPVQQPASSAQAWQPPPPMAYPMPHSTHTPMMMPPPPVMPHTLAFTGFSPLPSLPPLQPFGQHSAAFNSQHNAFGPPPPFPFGGMQHYTGVPPPPLGFPAGFAFDPPPPASPSVAIRLRHAQATVPNAGGFYESATISSTLRTRAMNGAQTYASSQVLAPVEPISVRSIDILSPRAHSISDASEVMTKPVLTKLTAYQEKHPIKITLHRKQSASGTRSTPTGAPASPLSSPLRPNSGSYDTSVYPSTPPHRPSSSALWSATASPRHRALNERPQTQQSIRQSPSRSCGPLMTQQQSSPPTSLLQLQHPSLPPQQPAPPTFHIRAGNQHQRSNSSQLPPSQSFSAGPQAPPSPLSAPYAHPRGPFVLRGNLFPNAAVPAFAHPPVSFHPINRHKQRRREASLSSSQRGFTEESKSAEEQEDPTTLTTLTRGSSDPTDDLDTTPQSYTSDPSRLGSSAQSEAVSIQPSPAHSRDPSMDMHNAFAAQHRGQFAGESSDSKTEAESSGEPSSTSSPSMGPVSSRGAPAAMSDLPPVPESGASLEGSLTASQRQELPQPAAAPSSAPLFSPAPALHPAGRPSLSLASPRVGHTSLDLSVLQEGTLDTSALKRADDAKSAAAASTGPKKFTMESFWAMHDHAGEHDSPDTDSEAEEAAAEARRKALHDKNSSDTDEDKFDSNPHAVLLQRRAKAASTRRKAGQGSMTSQQFLALQQDSSSTDSEEENERLKQRQSAAPPLKFITGAKRKKSKGKTEAAAASKKTSGKSSGKATGHTSPSVASSAAELLTASLSHLARAQMQAEVVLRTQKSRILGWFSRAQGNVQSKKQARASQNDAQAQQQASKEATDLAEAIKSKAQEIKALREAKRTRIVEQQTAAEEKEAREKVFAMLGGKAAVQQAAEQAAAAAGVDPPPPSASLQSPPVTTLFTSSDLVMSYVEIEHLLSEGRGSQPAVQVYQHLLKMEAAGNIQFASPSQLTAAVKVLSLPIEVTNMDMVHHEIQLANLPAAAERFVLKHSEVELEMYRVLKLSKQRKRNSKRRSRQAKRGAERAVPMSKPTMLDGESMLAVDEGIEPSSLVNSMVHSKKAATPRGPASTGLPAPTPALLQHMKSQQLIFEDHQAREELLERLTIVDNNVLFDGDNMLTPAQVEQLIEAGHGSKPTLRHIVQMEVEKVKFSDPTQLISAVQVLTLPADLEYNERVLSMELIQSEVNKRHLPESAQRYVLKHSEVDIELNRFEINLKRRSGKQMTMLMAMESNQPLSDRSPRRFRESSVSAQQMRSIAKEANVVTLSAGSDEDTAFTVELVGNDESELEAQARASAPDFFNLSPEAQEKERLRIEEELARREVHKRLLPASIDSRLLSPHSGAPSGAESRKSLLFADGTAAMTQLQVAKLIEAGRGSKPTLRHIVQMEVEKVQFSDPMQLITAVAVLSVPTQSSQFNLERIEREITQGRVKLPASAVEYVMKHSEVELEMHQVRVIGLALSGNAGVNFMADMQSTLAGQAAALKTAQVTSLADDSEGMMLVLEDDEAPVLEGADAMEQLRDEVARAEVHLRLENARSKLFKAQHTRMTSGQVDELIDQGNGGQPTLRHIVEMEVEQITFEDPQQLISAVKVMNLPIAAKRASQSGKEQSGEPCTRQDVAAAAEAAHLPRQIVEYVLKHSDVQLELAKVVHARPVPGAVALPVPVAHSVFELAHLDMDSSLPWDMSFGARSPSSSVHSEVESMRSEMVRMEREIQVLQSEDASGLMEEWVVSEEGFEQELQAQAHEHLLQVPLSNAQSRRSSLLTFEMTPQLVEDLIEETQAGDYLVTHLEKMSRSGNQGPFHSKAELVAAVTQEHAAYMEVEAHARLEVHHRLEHDRPQGVFKHGATMAPKQVDQLIEHGHGAVPTLKHIVKMEHSNVKFKEPTELISAVKVLAQPIREATLETVSHDVLAARLPPEASKYIMQVMALEMQILDNDIAMDEVEVERGGHAHGQHKHTGSNSSGGRTAQSGQASVPTHSPRSSASPVHLALGPSDRSSNRRSLVAHPRVLSPGFDDMVEEEQIGESSRLSHSSSRSGRRDSETLNAARRAHAAGVASPSYLQPAVLPLSPTSTSGRPTNVHRHSLGVLPANSSNSSPSTHASGTLGNSSSLHNTLDNSPASIRINRRSLGKSGQTGQPQSHPAAQPNASSGPPSPSHSHFQSSHGMPPRSAARLEADFTMVDDDSTLMRAGSVSRSHSRINSANRHSNPSTVPPLHSPSPTHFAQHTIQIRPAHSYQASPVMSLHNTMSGSQLRAGMAAGEEPSGAMTIGVTEDERFVRFQGSVDFDAMRASPVPIERALTPVQPVPRVASPSFLSRRMSPSPDADQQMHPQSVPQYMPAPRALSPRLTHRPAEFSGSSSTLEVHRPTEIRRFSLTTPMNVSQDITPGSAHDTSNSAAASPDHGKPGTGSPHSRSQSTAKLPFDSAAAVAASAVDRPSSLPSGHLHASPPPFLRVVSPHILSVPLPHSGNNSLTNTLNFGANGSGGASGHNSPSSRSPSHSPALRPFMVMVTEPSRHPSKDTSRAQSPTAQQASENMDAQQAESADKDSGHALDSQLLQESLLNHSRLQEREQAQELALGLRPQSEARSSSDDGSVVRSPADSVLAVHGVSSLHSSLPSLLLPDATSPPMNPLSGHRHADSTGAMSESSMMQLQSSPISPAGELDSGASSPSVSRQHTLHRPGSLHAGIALSPSSPQASSPHSAGSPHPDSQHNSGSQHTRRLGVATGSPHSGSPVRSSSPPAQTPPIGSLNSQSAARQVTLLSLASSSVVPGQPSSPQRGAVKSRIANEKRDSKKGSPKQSPKTTPKQTPKSSPSQSLQPTPMHSLSVTPSASPRSSGGAMAYSNMAATVSSKAKTSSGLSAPATAVVRIVAADPAATPPAVVRRTSLTVPNASGLSGSASATTLSIPNARNDPRRLSTGGTPLSDVREKEFDQGTGSSRDSATGAIAGSSRSSTSSVHSQSEEARAEIEQRKSEILAFNSEVASVTAPSTAAAASAQAPNLSPPPSPSPFPAAAAASAAVAPGSGSKRAPRRTNTMAEWSEHDDEALRLSARTKKPAAMKQHRKAGSVMTASYLQPTMSSSGAIAVPSTRDSTSPLPTLPPSSPSLLSSASGHVPSFMLPTQSHAVKFGRPSAAPIVRQRRPSNASSSTMSIITTPSNTEAPRRRRRESKPLGPGEIPIDEASEEGPAGSARHKRTGSVEEPVDEEDDAFGTSLPPQSNPASVRAFSTPTGAHAHHSIDFGRIEIERAHSIDKDTAAAADSTSGGTQTATAAAAAATAALLPSAVVPAPIIVKRTPWQPSVPLSLLSVHPSSTPSSSPRSADAESIRPRVVSQPLSLVRSATLTDEELAHQAEIDRVRGENERRRKAKELAALQEAQRLQALANDPAEQLRLRRDKRKNEFRNRKHAEHSAEEARKLAEEAQAKADAERCRLARDRAELLEAERVAAESRADTERLVAERVAKELDRKNKIIEEFERKRAEEAEQRRQAEEAERIANIPKYLVTGTVAAAARMLDNARAAAVRGGDPSAAESAAEYLDKMRARSELLRENAALKRHQLDAAKASLLHTRDDQLAAHIAEIRRNKAELFESEKAQLELYTQEKERKAADNLRQLQMDSDADVAAKHAELQSKIKAAQSKHHASDADRARELESILRDHEEESRRKAEYVSSKMDQLKSDKARDNELMLLKARGLKELLLEQQEEELRVLVEGREHMREKAAQNQSGPNAYTPKVGIDYFAEHDLLHLAGLPANHPMMLQAGISKIDEHTGTAVWQANQSQMQLTNVGSSAPASYAAPAAAAAASSSSVTAPQQSVVSSGPSDRSGLDSSRFTGPGSPIRSMRANTVTAREPGQNDLFRDLGLHSFSELHTASRRAK